MADKIKGGPLVLEEQGSFFLNGKVITSNYPSVPAVPGTIVVNQMYVRYMKPQGNQKLPVVMVHGSGLSGKSFETTPDGRMGWDEYFVRRGYSSYVVDHAGRARSGFDPTQINQAKAESNPALIPSLAKTTREAAWVGFRIGPSFGVPYPGEQFPIEAFDQHAAEYVPNAEVTLVGGGANTTNALVALLDKIGPAIVIAHSQGSSYGLGAAVARPQLVKALVLLEGSCAATPSEIASAYVHVPFMAVIGDNRPPDRNVQCQTTVEAINQAGGVAKFLLLPDAGIMGNSHMMMMDKNNLDVADAIIEWVDQNTGKKAAKK
jgi:pimeloyl-ACP methyl ester carboxylesterase